MDAEHTCLHLEHWADPDFPLVAIPAGVGAEFSAHTHDFWELVFVRHGGGVHVIDGRPYPMLRGDFYVMRPDDVHGYRDPADGSAIVNLLFRPEVLPAADWAELQDLPGLDAFLARDADEPPHKLALTPRDARLVDERCQRLIEERQEALPGHRLTMRAIFTALLVHIARCASTYGRQPLRGELAPGPVAAALALLHEHYDEPLSVAELAEAVELSPNWFGECFKRETGLSVQAYHNKLRVDHARLLLEEGVRSITDIALTVGYEDPSYFGRQFKKLTGLTPRAYRQLGAQHTA